MAQERTSKGIRWGWIILGLIVLVVAVGFAMKAVDGGFQYYLTANEYLQRRESLEGRYVKIAGFVKKDSLEQENQTYRFAVEFDGVSLPVEYTGFVPDTFKEGVEVVVEGRSSKSGKFIATNLMAKCASKYEVGQVPSLEQQNLE